MYDHDILKFCWMFSIREIPENKKSVYKQNKRDLFFMLKFSLLCHFSPATLQYYLTEAKVADKSSAQNNDSLTSRG